MLSHVIFDNETAAQQQAVVSTEASVTWSEFRQLARSVLGRQDLARRRVGLPFRPTASSYAALAALDRLGCDAFLLAPDVSPEEAAALAEKLKLGALLDWTEDGLSGEFRVREFCDEATWSGASSVTILTS